MSSNCAPLRREKRVGYWQDVEPDFASAKAELDDHLFAEFGGAVHSGPFKGMILPRDTAWPSTRLSPMLLGCYEEELHGVIHREIERLEDIEKPRIVVIGCAEGYYAIGLKRRLPQAEVFAIDNESRALAILQAAAHANDVGIKIGCDLSEVMAQPDLIVSDCEGAEVGYLDRDKFPGIVRSHMIVEIHNWPGQKTDDILLNRFRGTHRIDMLVEGPRNPNRFNELTGMTSDYRWMAVSEERPVTMCWYHMQPRGWALA